MTDITASWTPFSGFGMTRSETLAQLKWATNQISAVCGLNYKWVPGRGHVHAVARYDGGGQSNGKVISLNVRRDWTGRDHFIFGGVALHEYVHSRPINWGHSPCPACSGTPSSQDPYRHYLMHPWVSNVDWFAPQEVVRMQKQFGKPDKPFRVHPIWYQGLLVRRERHAIDRLNRERQNWIDARDKTKNLERRKYFHSQVERLNEEILAAKRRLQGRAKVWFSRVEFWQKTTVPFAKIPNITGTTVEVGE